MNFLKRMFGKKVEQKEKAQQREPTENERLLNGLFDNLKVLSYGPELCPLTGEKHTRGYFTYKVELEDNVTLELMWDKYRKGPPNLYMFKRYPAEQNDDDICAPIDSVTFSGPECLKILEARLPELFEMYRADVQEIIDERNRLNQRKRDMIKGYIK